MKNIYKLVLISIALVLFAVAIFVFRPVSNKLTRITVLGDSHAKLAPDTARGNFFGRNSKQTGIGRAAGEC